MLIKCYEQNSQCSNQKKLGNNFYCGLDHTPNHVWEKNEYGIIHKTDKCAEKEFKKEKDEKNDGKKDCN
jgi:hypothetical protein